MLAVFLFRLIDFYSLLVVAAVVLSWIPAARDNPIARFIESVTEPVLSRIRAVVPPIGGFDVSPLLLLLALRMLQRLFY